MKAESLRSMYQAMREYLCNKGVYAFATYHPRNHVCPRPYLGRGIYSIRLLNVVVEDLITGDYKRMLLACAYRRRPGINMYRWQVCIIRTRTLKTRVVQEVLPSNGGRVAIV